MTGMSGMLLGCEHPSAAVNEQRKRSQQRSGSAPDISLRDRRMRASAAKGSSPPPGSSI